MTAKKILITTVALFFLSGCGILGEREKIEVRTVPTKPIVIHPEMPQQLDLEPVNVIVANRKRLQDLLDSEDADTAYWILTTRDYENLAKNREEIERWIREAREIILFYRRVLPNEEETNEPVSNSGG